MWLSDADATLNAECGEECCDHAYDKLEYSLERFFVFCVTHGIRSLKLLTWLFSPATFGAPPRCVRLLPAFFVSDSKDTTSPKINHTFLYVSCDSRTFSFKFLNFRTRIARKFLSTEHTEYTEKDFRRMIKVTPSDFRHQTSDFILVKDFVQDSSLDFEP